MKRSRLILTGSLCGILCLTCSYPLTAQETPSEPATETVPAAPVEIDVSPDDETDSWVPHLDSLFNIEMQTLGGRQFWGDVAYFQGWKIQENILTHHFRLLDPADKRRAWGTLEGCQKELESFKQQLHLAPMSGKAVILIHGIGRSSKSFGSLREKLAEAGYAVVGFEYPSTRITLEESVEYLQQVIDSLEGIEQIDIVVHSMGGLLVRTYVKVAGEDVDPRFRRLVMLGVPNQGAQMANLLKDNSIYQFVYGPAGQQLIEDKEGYIASLPRPPFETGIIAGARGTLTGWNPLVPGDDDGTISVECTRLPGAADFITVPSLHSFIMTQPDAMQATLHFLETGCFRESGEPVPIPIEPEASETASPESTSKTPDPTSD